MNNEIINNDIKIKPTSNCFDFMKDKEKVLEKGSIENILFESDNKRHVDSSAKEISRILDDKDDEFEEKKLNCDLLTKEFSKNEQDVGCQQDGINKNFNFETLNRDLTDIEERLRATRLSWNKNGKSFPMESNEMSPTQKDVVRKSWSLLDIDKRPYSNGSSFNELDNCKRYSGEKLTCDSPALSEGLLKWDYGADIGLTQDDSDDMEPITWPVTAEQAQRDAQASELGGMGRRLKISLSQGSFLSSPDPEDRHNLIAKISAEYKSNHHSDSLRNKNPTSSTEIISLVNGIYDDLSARQIMEQAEAAEKRLRQRLEAVKALNFKDNLQSHQLEDTFQSAQNDRGIVSNERSIVYSESPQSREVSFDKNVLNDDFLTDVVKCQQSKLCEDIVSDLHKQISGDDDCRSPTSITNTGRTTTMESTHTSSDYGRAPVFTGDTYGSRKDPFSSENNFVMYSKQNKDLFMDKVRSYDTREMRNPRLICGIAPELDTISSRETLQMTDEKKDDLISNSFNRKLNENSNINNEILNTTDGAENLSDKDVSQEHSLQAKWNQFKTLMKGDEYNNLFEKTTIRSPVQYPISSNLKSIDQPNTHRQISATTTFTTITNVSPRYDSFATDVFKNLPKELNALDRNPNNKKYGTEEDSKNKSNGGKVTGEKHSKSENQRYESNRYLQSRSRSGKRLTGGGGGGRDNDDNDEISQTERRKLRHAAELARFKKRFGSGQLDGETTASELEHDDLSKLKRNLMDKEIRKRQLSHMLTEISKEGVAENSVQDLTDVSQSSSVDTMLLMNKMSHLLRKKKSENLSKREFRKYSPDKPRKKPHVDSLKRNTAKMSSNKIIESDDAKLVLKHLMLKQKVKWLADCAREEARRRKIRKLEKLMDLYEHGNPVIIPDDLETETATLMGSDRASQNDLSSQTDSCSFYDDEITNPAAPLDPPVVLDNYNNTSKKQRKHSKSPPIGKHYINSKYKNGMAKDETPSLNKRKYLPPSEAWHIPLHDPVYQDRGNVNESNEYRCESPEEYVNNGNRYRSSHGRDCVVPSRPVNLTVKERVQLRRELELARQRNAHECQKDIRHTKTGDTKVANGGLAWMIGLRERNMDNESQFHSMDNNRKSNLHFHENAKDQSNIKSELQFAFENRMGSFISKSRQRQKRIKLAVDERRYESQMNLERARLFVSNNDACGPKRRRPLTQPDPLSANRTNAPNPMETYHICAPRPLSQNGRKSTNSENLYKPHRRSFSKSEMRNQSAKKYQALPEVQAKYLDERRKAKMQNNRMKMHLYGERILQSLLRNRGPWVSNRA